MATGVAVFQPQVAVEQVFLWLEEDAGDFSAQHYMLCFLCALACTVQSSLGCYNGGLFCSLRAAVASVGQALYRTLDAYNVGCGQLMLRVMG
jgi:hypothetical protein